MNLETERLLLRHWREDDLEPFAALNADPEVMRFFESTQTREQSDAWAEAVATRLDTLGLDEVVSFTAVPNRPSRRVMERLAMSRDPDGDFDHPAVSAGHPLARHVLYRVSRTQRQERA